MGTRRLRNHWLSVSLHFVLDAALIFLAYYLASVIRFGEHAIALGKFSDYMPSMITGALFMPSICYILGLYGRSAQPGLSIPRRLSRVVLAVGLAITMMLLVGGLNYSARIGRGVLFIGAGLSGILALLHHTSLGLLLRQFGRQKIACLVTSTADEVGAQLYRSIDNHGYQFAGIIVVSEFQTDLDLPTLGTSDKLHEVVNHHGLAAILCSEAHLADSRLSPILRQLRYRGTEIVSLADACESAYHAMPLELVTDGWLIRASSQPALFYIKKVKRALDIVLSLLIGLLALPLLLAGMLAVKIASPGPIFYSQVRSGRFGRQFRIFKLRTMHLDAEKSGAQWAAKDDPRLFSTGKWLRKFRIDEIPQLWNILRGEMSFVGPRPERPEFVEQLEKELPGFSERLLIHPGLTGWAQVRYPYGASVEDARRKLEYDLYYLKHMSVVLDLFILIDTAWIVCCGGVKGEPWAPLAKFSGSLRSALTEPVAAAASLKH